MNVSVNNTIWEVADSCTIADVLLKADMTTQQGIAVAVNNSVITRIDWPTFMLQEKDQITIIKATQGG